MPTSYAQNRPLVMDIIDQLKPESILEIGTGWGDYGVLVRKAYPDIRLDGIEIWDYKNERWDNYDNVYKADIRDFNYPPYALYLMIDIIEHVSKEDGHKILSKLKYPVIVSTPIDYPQENRENPYENHISQWYIDDFKDYDYDDYSNELSTIILIRPKDD